jgi:ABC-type uncharacterized transport system substrate-binding protein
MSQVNRRRLVLGVGAMLAMPVPSRAQPKDKVRMVGVLTVTNPVHGKLYWDAFAAELRKYGWVEGKNLTIKYLSANGDVKRLDELAREFVTLKSDVLCGRACAQI